MPESFSIDLDFERVLLDGAWYSRDDSTLRIKTMVDSGDFKVGRPSAALEALELALADSDHLDGQALPRGPHRPLRRRQPVWKDDGGAGAGAHRALHRRPAHRDHQRHRRDARADALGTGVLRSTDPG